MHSWIFMWCSSISSCMKYMWSITSITKPLCFCLLHQLLVRIYIIAYIWFLCLQVQLELLLEVAKCELHVHLECLINWRKLENAKDCLQIHQGSQYYSFPKHLQCTIHLEVVLQLCNHHQKTWNIDVVKSFVLLVCLIQTLT